jgi:GNAT superfamily N-acetyltransferase
LSREHGFVACCSLQRIIVTASLTIRPLVAADRAAWEPLWTAYLAFYKTSLPASTFDATWSRLMDPAEPMHAFGAELDGKLVGIVHYIFHRTTWTTGDYCYLQDLFTAEAARGKGAGRALIEAVYAAAREKGASRVYWLTQNDNATARALYDKLADHPGYTVYRHVF